MPPWPSSGKERPDVLRYYRPCLAHYRCSSGQSAEQAASFADASLRNAWLSCGTTTRRCASIVNLDFDTGRFYKTYRTIRSDADRDAWLESTFVLVSTNQDGIEFANSDPPASKYPTLFVLSPPASVSPGNNEFIRRDPVLRSPHDIIDGIGTLLLLNNYITHAARAFANGALLPGAALQQALRRRT